MRGFPRIRRSTVSIWSVLSVAALGAASCRLTPPSGSQGDGASGNPATGGQYGGAAGQSASSGSGGSTGGQTSKGGSGASGGSGEASGGTSGNGGTRGSGGTSGGGGAGGSGGAGSATIEVRDAAVPDTAVDTAPPPPSRGPTPSQAGVKFPFPQNRENSRCIYPTAYRNENVQAAYDQWKTDTVTSDGAKGFRRVKRPNDPGLEANSTVSEGIAYGMLTAVYMNDQTLFDDLWQYEQQHLGQYGLMDWNIKADGSGPADGGGGPATDADEDMAFALLMADKQWGGQGKLSKKYIDFAKGMMTNIWNNEIFDFKYLRSWPGADSSAIVA